MLSDTLLENRSFTGKKLMKYESNEFQNLKHKDTSTFMKKIKKPRKSWGSPLPLERSRLDLGSPQNRNTESTNLSSAMKFKQSKSTNEFHNRRVRFRVKEEFLDKEEIKYEPKTPEDFKHKINLYTNCLDDFNQEIKPFTEEGHQFLKRISTSMNQYGNKLYQI
jgi:hypothetical protein